MIDGLGHVRALVNPSGAITEVWHYDSWGNPISPLAQRIDQPFLWNGAYGYKYIPFTGLYHVGAREYDPRTARWLQRERIALLDGHPNLYIFSWNNPINNIDNDGFASRNKDYPEGHHIVPRSIWKDLGLPEDAIGVLNNAVTGPISGHRWDKHHAEYNKAVKEMWDKWIKECGIDPAKMTPDQALHFVMKVMRSEDRRIANFLANIAQARGVSLVQMKLDVLLSVFSEGEWARILKEGLDAVRLDRLVQKITQNKLFRNFALRILGRAAGKANILVTVGLFVATAFQHGIIQACNDALWPISELWSPGPIRTLLGE